MTSGDNDPIRHNPRLGILDLIILAAVTNLLLGTALYWLRLFPLVAAVCISVVLYRLDRLGWIEFSMAARFGDKLVGAVAAAIWCGIGAVLFCCLLAWLFGLRSDLPAVVLTGAATGAVMGFTFDSIFKKIPWPF
jgi:hypothetical protein